MAKPKFEWEELQYTPFYLKQHDEKELRKEYSRLRSIYRKRWERLKESEFADSETVRHYGKLPPIAQIKDKQQLVYALAEAAKFLRKDISLRNMRKRRTQTIKTLHEHNYTFVTKENYLAFASFMSTFATVAQSMTYDSDQIAELYQDGIIKRDIDPADLQQMFSDFVEAQRKAPGKKKFRGGKMVLNSADIEEWRENLFS